MPEGAYSRVAKHVKKSTPVDDGIMMIDCTPLCNRLGLRWMDCGSIWFVKDICGVVCAVFTYALVLFAQFVVMYVVIIPRMMSLYSFFHGIVFNLGCFLAVASHVRAMLSDPGAVPKGNATRENIMRLDLKEGEVIFKCPKCVCIKPERAHHCSVCGRCIRKMDHHCPWVNNCIGENNQKYFVLFTMYICIISCHALYLSINHFVTCVNDNWKECMAVSPPATTVFLIFLVFEGLLFGIFTAIMCGSQLQSICTDETGIEQLKKEQGSWEKKTYWMSLKEVFGHPFSIHWFSPFSHVQHGKQKMYMYAV